MEEGHFEGIVGFGHSRDPAGGVHSATDSIVDALSQPCVVAHVARDGGTRYQALTYVAKPSLDARDAVNHPAEFEQVAFGGANGTSAGYFCTRVVFTEAQRLEAEYRMALAPKVSREDI